MSDSLKLLIDLIKKFEGCSLTAYPCPASVPTIGYGHTGTDVRIGMPAITQERADDLLHKDASSALTAALRLSPRLAKESPERQAAIADFIFNIGAGRYRTSTLKKRVDSGVWDDVPVQLMKWVLAGVPGRVQPGLVNRRRAECELVKLK